MNVTGKQPRFKPISIKSKPLLGLAIIVICVSNVLQYSISTSGFPQGDSWAYAFGSDQNWNLVSFTGHSLRKWPIVVLNLLLHSDQIRILFLCLLSIFAWAHLLITTHSKLRMSNYVTCLLAVLASTPEILSWNSVQLSESYAISFTVLSVSYGLRFFAFSRHRDFMALSLSLFLFLNSKPSNFLALVVVLIALTPLFIWKLLQGALKGQGYRLLIISIVVQYSFILTFNQASQELQSD